MSVLGTIGSIAFPNQAKFVSAYKQGKLGKELLATAFPTQYAFAQKFRKTKNEPAADGLPSPVAESLGELTQTNMLTNEILTQSLALQQEQNEILKDILNSLGNSNGGGLQPWIRRNSEAAKKAQEEKAKEESAKKAQEEKTSDKSTENKSAEPVSRPSVTESAPASKSAWERIKGAGKAAVDAAASIGAKGANLYFIAVAVFGGLTETIALYRSGNPNFWREATVIWSKIVAEFGVAIVGGMIAGAIASQLAGSWNFEIGAIPGFIVGFAGGYFALEAIGANVDDFVAYIVRAVFQLSDKEIEDLKKPANGADTITAPTPGVEGAEIIHELTIHRDRSETSVIMRESLTFNASDEIKFIAGTMELKANEVILLGDVTGLTGALGNTTPSQSSSVTPSSPSSPSSPSTPSAPGSPSAPGGAAADRNDEGAGPPASAGGANAFGLKWAAGVDTRIQSDIAGKAKSMMELFPDMVITSGYRDAARNARAGGAGGSMHLQGKAVDIQFQGDPDRTNKFVLAASRIGAGGIGVYRPGLVHIDTGSRRYWGPSYHAGSEPAWSRPALQQHMNNGRQEQAPQTPRYEKGTPYAPGGKAIVGEKGSEKIKINGKTYKTPNGPTKVNLPKGARVEPHEDNSALDIGVGLAKTAISFVPIAGQVAAGAEAAYYGVQGDYKKAGRAAIGAIPGGGIVRAVGGMAADYAIDKLIPEQTTPKTPPAPPPTKSQANSNKNTDHTSNKTQSGSSNQGDKKNTKKNNNSTPTETSSSGLLKMFHPGN